jgi:hypothetical protein
VVQLYGRMLRCLEASGLSKAASATPLEFAGRVSREWRDAGRFVEPLTDLYCRVRFGRAPFSSDDDKQAQALLTGLECARPGRRTN